jgi:choice-of-anchor A domain-containing protein
VTGTNNTAVSGAATGLIPNTNYFYRVVASNAGGTTNAAEQAFTTPVIAPNATATPATSVTATSATLNGTVNANNADTSVRFELRTASGSYSSPGSLATPPSVSGSIDTPVSFAVSGLVPNTIYFYHVVATNAGGTATSAEQSFTTAALPPTVAATPATNVTATSATLNGTVNANNATTTDVHFDLRMASGSYASLASLPNVSGTLATPVSGAVSGLIPNTTYFYRVVASNAGGTATSAEQSFTTTAAGPTAVTKPATKVTPRSAMLNATVNPNGKSTTVVFKWGVSSGVYPKAITLSPQINGTSDIAVSALLLGLKPNTTYYYRVVATSSGGTATGAEQSFRTAVSVLDFNVYTLQDATFSGNPVGGSLVQGRVASGGNATLTSMTIGGGLPNSNGTRDDLIVGGNLTYNSGALASGNIVYSGTATLTNVTMKHGTARQVANPLSTSTDAWAANVATTWASLPANGSVTGAGTTALNLTGADKYRNVFAVSAADLGTARTLRISVPSRSSVVINVSGAQVSIQNLNITIVGTDRLHVVYNFYAATSLAIGPVAVPGTIWAPSANVTVRSSSINGTLLAKSLQAAGASFNQGAYEGPEIDR